MAKESTKFWVSVTSRMITALDAIARLKEGNRRFVSGQQRSSTIEPDRWARLAESQTPFAIILGCSDSRVPVELVFDQGFGDLFVIRVAGNVAAPSQVGSVEFAVDKFGIELVVVLGHTRCGAIEAALKEPDRSAGNCSVSLNAILEHIRPTVQRLKDAAVHTDHDTLIRQAVRANIQAQLTTLTDSSESLSRRVEANRLMLAGAQYDLVTGEVDFLDHGT